MGSADLGGAWTTTGTAAVTPGAGSLTDSTAGSSTSALLAALSQPDADVSATFTTTKAPTGGGQTFYLVGRRANANNEYRAVVTLKSNGAVTLAITKLDGSSTEVTVAAAATVAGLSYSPGVALSVRFVALGSNPTTLAAKVWRAAQPQPANWSVFGQDSGAGIQAPGTVGLRTAVSSTATNSPTGFTVTAFTAAPAS